MAGRLRQRLGKRWLSDASLGGVLCGAAALALVLSGCGGGPATPVGAPNSAGRTPAAGRTPTTNAPAPGTASSAVPPRPDHLVVVIFENKGASSQSDPANAPFLASLFGRAAVFTNSRAVTHPSQPNYLALFSGSTQGVTSDRCLTPFHDRANLGQQLDAAGLTFTGYSENLPAVGFAGCSSGRYAAKHNPWVHFDNVPATANQPYSAFPRTFDRLPSVSFVIPNLCNDMHDCSTRVGDRWLRDNLGPYIAWAQSHHSLLLVTYDENDGAAGNQILTLLVGAGIRPGRYAEPVTHYRVLRTIEAMFGLPPIGAAAATSPITDVWR
ncbi:MAG TPA: alkaline phosphatase family protein [Micromonosporaceae bacterium]|jgi:acid phosphatase|nr:alkaline phosphatase family protein [Micromonosporaceae bacterium]